MKSARLTLCAFLLLGSSSAALAGPADEAVSVRDYQAVPDGLSDSTQGILKAALRAKCLGRPLRFEKGTYLFQLRNDPRALDGDHAPQKWNFSRAADVDSAVFISRRQMLGSAFECPKAEGGDDIIGVQHNFLELKTKDIADLKTHSIRAIRLGDFMRPPLARKPPARLDLVAHWWSRFGSEGFLQPGQLCAAYDPCKKKSLSVDDGKCFGASGSVLSKYGPGDYTWEWAHKRRPPLAPLRCKDGSEVAVDRQCFGAEERDCLDFDYGTASYDPRRHPLLGWYRDSDPVVLDWISYWLVTYGVTAVALPYLGPNYQGFTKSVDKMFDGKVPNFRQLRYVIWLPETSDAGIWRSIMEKTYFKRPAQTYLIRPKGSSKRYAAVYLYNWPNFAAAFHGHAEMTAFLAEGAAQLKRHGVADGMIVLANNLGSLTENAEKALREKEVLIGAFPYSGGRRDQFWAHRNPDTYANLMRSMIDSELVDAASSVVSVPVAMESVPPHFSNFPWKGSTPKLFEAWLGALARAVSPPSAARPFSRPVIGLNNVSEWLEAGACLQPNMGDGFGYLEAVRRVQAGPSGNSEATVK